MDDDLPSYDAVVSGVDTGGGFNAAIPGGKIFSALRSTCSNQSINLSINRILNCSAFYLSPPPFFPSPMSPDSDPEVGWSLEATESRKNAGKTEKKKAQDSKEVGRPPTVLERRPVVRDGGGRGAQRQPGMFSISAFHERMTRSDDTYGSVRRISVDLLGQSEGTVPVLLLLIFLCCGSVGGSSSARDWKVDDSDKATD